MHAHPFQENSHSSIATHVNLQGEGTKTKNLTTKRLKCDKHKETKNLTIKYIPTKRMPAAPAVTHM